MELDISKVSLSKFDIKRGLTLPTHISNPLAEDIGIMIGDGHIGLYTEDKKEYAIYVSGNATKEKSYISNHVNILKKQLYNLDFPVSQVKKNEIRIKICSKGLVEFYHKTIGLPVNKKGDIGIPKIIWSNKEYIASCLRGIMDTDFGLCFKKTEKYPVFQLKTSSNKLVNDCKKAFKILGIKANIYENRREFHKITKNYFITNYLFINGRNNLEKYIKIIGSNSERINKIIKKNMGPRGHS